jgi:hypothetical protein
MVTVAALPQDRPRSGGPLHAGPGTVPPRRLVALIAFCLSGPLLIAFHATAPGALVWSIALVLILRDPEPAFRRRMGVLLGTLAILALAPIHTDTSNRHFLTLGIPFFLVIAGPALVLGRSDPGVIRYRIWPRRFRWIDIVYVILSIPLAYLALELYFVAVSPDVPGHWFLPRVRDTEAVWRLFVGINCVGIWDELFFVNTVFATLRSVFPYRVANAAQAVIYTTVLYRMAFTGMGPWLIYPFALTQGAMFEGSDTLLYVLLVHLIVDAFLFSGILNFHYPGFSPIPF